MQAPALGDGMPTSYHNFKGFVFSACSRSKKKSISRRRLHPYKLVMINLFVHAENSHLTTQDLLDRLASVA